MEVKSEYLGGFEGKVDTIDDLKRDPGGDFLDFTPPGGHTGETNLEHFAPNMFHHAKYENYALAAVSAHFSPWGDQSFIAFPKQIRTPQFELLSGPLKDPPPPSP